MIDETKAKAEVLNRKLHVDHPALELAGKTVLVVDDGLATGATMIASLRWARASGAARVVAVVPVAAAESLRLIGREADVVVCPHTLEPFFAVGMWYASFAQVDDAEVIRLFEENRREQGDRAARAPEAPTTRAPMGEPTRLRWPVDAVPRSARAPQAEDDAEQADVVAAAVPAAADERAARRDPAGLAGLPDRG